MSFFGMSQAGKNARNNLNSMAGWNQTQANDWQAKAADLWKSGTGKYDWANQYWQNKANSGYTNPQDIRKTGETILPIDQAIATIRENQQKRLETWNAKPKAETFAQTQNEATGHLAEQVAPTYEFKQGAIDTAYNTGSAAADQAYTDSIGATDRNFGDAYNDWNTGLDRLVDENQSTRQDLLGLGNDMADRSMGYLSEWEKDIARLKPGGDFKAAQAARAFAPNMASAMGRLRRAGVDPNSVQAAALIGGVETSRARAMDDAMSQGTETYVNARGQLVNAKTGVLGDYRDYSSGVMKDALGNDINIGMTRASGNVGIHDRRGTSTQNAINTHGNAQIDLSQQRGAQTTANLQQSFDNTQGVTDRVTQNANNQFDMTQKDFETFNGLMNQADKNALTEVDMSKAQYLLGDDWTKADQTTKDNAAAAIQQLGSAEMQAMFNSGEMASRFGQQATDLYKQIFMTESANAGWGLKGLMGLAGAILPKLIPQKTTPPAPPKTTP